MTPICGFLFSLTKNSTIYKTYKIKKRGVKKKDVAKMLCLIITSCVKVHFENIVISAIRDPDDAYLLALAEATNAEFILTSGKDLLVLEEHNETQITSFSKFIQRYY